MSVYSDLQKVASELLTEFDQHNIVLIQHIYDCQNPDVGMVGYKNQKSIKKYRMKNYVRNKITGKPESGV